MAFIGLYVMAGWLDLDTQLKVGMLLTGRGFESGAVLNGVCTWDRIKGQW